MAEKMGQPTASITHTYNLNLV